MFINSSKISSLIRSASIVYANDNMNRKTDTIKARFIEATFVLNGNKASTVQDIMDNLEDNLNIIFGENEIIDIIQNYEKFEYIGAAKASDDKYKLIEKRFRYLSEKNKDVIEETYDRFLSTHEYDKSVFEDVMHRYLYYLLNTNIDAFSAILKGSMPTTQSIDQDSFSSDDIEIINKFLEWNDDNKNESLYKLASYCIEYAVVVNNSNESILSNSIKNKTFYIDNALIYRALGVNGKQRKRRTQTFFKKCIETGQILKITSISRKEFFESIEYHIQQIRRTTPFGRINPELFRRISGSGFYSYYHEWKAGKLSYGFETFKASMTSEYNNLLEVYKIKEDFKCPFDIDGNIPKIEAYKNGIKAVKTWNGNTKNDNLHLYDAQNIYWVESLRDGNDKKLEHTKYYFITSDLKLQSWDYEHAPSCQPVTLLPSQWLALLLKYTSRSKDDYKSFVSFLTIPREKHIVDEEELQTILAGISEVTEDLKQQTDLVSEMFSNNFKDILKGNTRENAKAFVKDKLEQKYKETIHQKEDEFSNQKSSFESELSKRDKTIEEIKKDNDKRFKSLQDSFNNQLQVQEKERQQGKLDSLKRELLPKEQLFKIITKYTKSHMFKLRFLFGLPVVIVIILWAIWLYIKGPSSVEKWTYIIPLIFPLLSLIYFIIKGKGFNFKELYKNYKKSYLERECDKHQFSQNEIKDIKESIDKLNKELKSDNK